MRASGIGILLDIVPRETQIGKGFCQKWVHPRHGNIKTVPVTVQRPTHRRAIARTVTGTWPNLGRTRQKSMELIPSEER
jgi:hypothetical protein